MSKRKVPGVESSGDTSDSEGNPSKKARVIDDEEIEETDEQKEFEAKFEERVRERIASKARLEGRIAELGIIQSLEMHQFMCHPRLSFQFGPQINFIIGHNGSGKSAVLSAITVALGGKATSTGRGSGLRSFIREGQSASEVSITLKNEGEDAFKPDVYGKSITITRRFTKDSGSYKIKSREGKIVSTKREELSAILDHMNIQVDNPMNILSQDASRQFLSSSHPSQKYEFFMKGTQLKQLSDEYEACLENVEKTGKFLNAKRSALPDLKNVVKRANERWKTAEKAVEQMKKMDELKKEQAWAHVEEKGQELQTSIEAVEKSRKRLDQAEANARDADSNLDEANVKIAAFENELTELGDVNRLNAQKSEKQEIIRSNKAALLKYKYQEKEMNVDLDRNKQIIKDLEERIVLETKRLDEDKRAEREELEQKLKETQDEVDMLEKDQNGVRQRLDDKKREFAQLKSDVENAERARGRAEAERENCTQQLNNIGRLAEDSLNAYGTNLPKVLNEINTQRWHGETPKGPIGRYVTLIDQQWANIMRLQLASIMMSFVVTDPQDKDQLRKILNHYKNVNTQIIIAPVDLFDYRSGEPEEGKLTVLRVLRITDEHIKRILINQLRIEQTYLAPTRSDGQRVVESVVRGHALAWTADLFRVINYGDGGFYSGALGRLDSRDFRMQLFLHGDPSLEKEQWNLRGREAERALRMEELNIREAHHSISQCRAAMDSLFREDKALTNKIRDKRDRLETLTNEHNEGVPVNISALEDAKADTEGNIQSIMEQFKHLLEEKRKVDEKQPPLLREVEEIKKQIHDYEVRQRTIRDKIEQVAEERLRAQTAVKHWNIKCNDERTKMKAAEEASDALKNEYEDWTDKAEKFCDGAKWDSPRKSAALEREVKALESALRAQQKEQGASIEELYMAMRDAQNRYALAERELKDLTDLNKLLKSSVVTRLARWHEFRRHIALRTKLHFQYHLSNRAYFGKVLFDHEKQRLDLKVQTDEQVTQGMNKDPKSLSGGEKSFSTICLLLALWEAIGCPIRCLDEFDVFMDAVNRRISMKMMIDTANASDGRQYILITPQDMSSVTFGPSVRVNRMGDPERGQNTLQFS